MVCSEYLPGTETWLKDIKQGHLVNHPRVVELVAEVEKCWREREAAKKALLKKKEVLTAKLTKLADESKDITRREEAHVEADRELIFFIDDVTVGEEFGRIDKWYD